MIEPTDKPNRKRTSLLWIVVSIPIGAFVGAFLCMAFFFSYPTPLPAWIHPGVFAVIGAIVGLLIVLWVRRGRR